ncbi:MAG: hypothetical protein GDA44_00535 [Prochloron sp. SP5CPC1]|nr:hypothetical protein [Candidatus Paraprochloron terpiosi SP5CPC1]
MKSAKTVRGLLKNGIIKKLEERFEKASKNLEQVNTGALVDSIYSEEEFSFLSLNCEQWDAFCRFLPNLLVSFGLLGTFFGITLNLSSVTGIINQNNSNLENLLTQLQQPLQGMGIAFITSLIAIACSATLTLVNLRWNTSLAKEKLISSLEDYLDNVLHPTIEGKTRLDKAVNSMVKQQNDFLIRFHEKVGAVLESTLKPVADRIAEENERSHQLAERVYEGMRDSSTTLLRGAENFREVTNMLQTSANTFAAASETIQESQFPERLQEATKTLDKFSESVSNLEGATKSIEGAIASLQHSTTKMVELAQQQVKSLNQQSAQTRELSDDNKQSLTDITTQLQQGAAKIAENIEALKRVPKYKHSLPHVNDLRGGRKFLSLLDNITTQLQQGADNIAALGVSMERLHDNNCQSLTEIATQLRIGAQNTAAFQKAIVQLNQNNQQSLTLISTKLEQGADNIAALGVSLEHFHDNNKQSLDKIIKSV